jgi:hypothetical protein
MPGPETMTADEIEGSVDYAERVRQFKGEVVF